MWGPFLFCCLAGLSRLEAAEVRVQRTAQGHWQLLVDGQQYFVQGVDYRVSKVGQSPDEGTLRDWATYDDDHDGNNDPAYQAWLDENRNDTQDAHEPSVGDFALMRRMHVNTIRWYMNDFPNQATPTALLRELYQVYGIRVAVCNKLGAYTIDSGASWKAGTDYRNPAQCRRMLASVVWMGSSIRAKKSSERLPWTFKKIGEARRAFSILLRPSTTCL